MGRRAFSLFFLMLFCCSTGNTQVHVEPQSVLVRLSSPGVISLDGNEVELIDASLQSAVASLTAAEPRIVRDRRLDSQPLLVLELGAGSALWNGLSALRAVPCVLRAEPNFILVADDPSQPSDYFFQYDVYPYSPFTTQNMVQNYSDWDLCEPTTDHFYTHPLWVDILNWKDNWFLERTQTNLAWLVEAGSKDVVVAIIDSGVDWRHPDLAQNIWNNPSEDIYGDGVIVSSNPGDPYAPWQFDSVDKNGVDDSVVPFSIPCDISWLDDLVGWRFHSPLWPGSPTLPLDDPNHGHCVPGQGTYGDAIDQERVVDLNGYQDPHGTMMASIIGAAHNGFGCAGVCPNVSLMAINAGKSIEATPSHSNPDSHGIGVDEMVQALEYAVCMGADIINISLSYYLDDYPPGEGESQELLEAINFAIDAGVIICSSAGNQGPEGRHNRWPAAISGVLSCASVRRDLEKTYNSCWGDHVSFCAPSGQTNDAAFNGDEYMVAVKFAPPLPYWPDYLPGHDASTPSGPYHSYFWTDGHTSGCAAQLSGSFALLKAHYPEHSREQLIEEMIRGAEDVDPYQPPGADWIGKLGHGMINPYRSLTEFGGPRDSELPDVIWSGEVWVSGDYTVPAGGTLTIEPGTTVHIANFDNEDRDTINPVVIQADRIYANGTDASRIKFEWYGPDVYNEGYKNRWEIRNGDSTSAVIQLAFCEFQKLGELQARGSTSAGEASYISDCIFSEDVGSSSNSLFASMIELSDCEFGARWSVSVEDSVQIEGCKFEQTAATQEAKPSILGYAGSQSTLCSIVDCIIRNSEVGIRWFGASGDSLFLEDVLIEHDYVQGLKPRGEIGVDVQGGCVTAKHLTLRGYTIGVNRQQATGMFEAEYSSFTDCSYAAMDHNVGPCAFFGMYVEPEHPMNKGGYNVFDENSVNVVNLHAFGQTTLARKNWWGSASGPPQGGFVGLVDPLFHLSEDPGLPDPPDFAVMVAETPAPFSVGRNYPNPFNPVTEFSLEVPPGGGQVSAIVYDIRGRIVRRLLNQELSSGENVIVFDGRDDAGEALPSGMYLCHFGFKDHVEVVKATLVK